MANLPPSVNIREPKTFPASIKDWLGSIQLVYLIIELNQRLGFTKEKSIVIPRLMWKIVIGEIPPQNMVNELEKQLGISPSAALTLAKEIEEKFFRPIETPLRSEFGIDTKLIYFGEEQEKERYESLSEEGPATQQQAASTPGLPKTPQIPRPPAPSTGQPVYKPTPPPMPPRYTPPPKPPVSHPERSEGSPEILRSAQNDKGFGPEHNKGQEVMKVPIKVEQSKVPGKDQGNGSGYGG